MSIQSRISSVNYRSFEVRDQVLRHFADEVVVYKNHCEMFLFYDKMDLQADHYNLYDLDEVSKKTD